MLQIFPKATVLALIAALAPLMLAVACATAAAPTPIPTDTPAPTATVAQTPVPTPTFTPAPTETPAPTATPLPTPTPDIGNWVQEDFADPINDISFLIIKLQASESSLTFPYDDPWLSVGCIKTASGKSEVGVLIVWGEYLGSDGSRVDWRVDSEPAKTAMWSSGSDDATRKLDSQQEVDDLLRAEKIAVRVHRDFAESLTAIWHPAGFAEAYKPVAEACGQ